MYAVYDEYKKKKIYAQQNIPIPLVFNISNPADSKTALNSLFKILDKKYPDHKKNLKKYFNILEDDLMFKYDGDFTTPNCLDNLGW
jgi:carbonic anhydrase